MNKGFTILEGLISLALASTLSVGIIQYQIEEANNTQIRLLAKEMNMLASGIDKRISIDGYKSDLWSQKSWKDDEISDLVAHQLQAKDSNCRLGKWIPKDNNLKLKLVDCNLFENRLFNLLMETKIIEQNGFIEKAITEYSFKDDKTFKKNFKNVKKAFVKAKADNKDAITGEIFYQYINKGTNVPVSVTECINLGHKCVYRITLDRQGGSEYLRIDGKNSMKDSAISFIDSSGNAPLKCVKWTKESSNKWKKEIDEKCGIGIYQKTGIPSSVEVVADNGTFENIHLNKECNLLSWNGSNVVDSPIKTPCGLSNNGNTIIQIVENIQSNSGYFKNIYANNVFINKIITKELISENIVAKKIRTQRIDSDIGNFENVNVSNKTTTKELAVKNTASVGRNLAVGGNISSNQVQSNYIRSNGNISVGKTLTSNYISSSHDITSRSLMKAPVGRFDNIEQRFAKIEAQVKKNSKNKDGGGSLRWRYYSATSGCTNSGNYNLALKGKACKKKGEVKLESVSTGYECNADHPQRGRRYTGVYVICSE